MDAFLQRSKGSEVLPFKKPARDYEETGESVKLPLGVHNAQLGFRGRSVDGVCRCNVSIPAALLPSLVSPLCAQITLQQDEQESAKAAFVPVRLGLALQGCRRKQIGSLARDPPGMPSRSLPPKSPRDQHGPPSPRLRRDSLHAPPLAANEDWRRGELNPVRQALFYRRPTMFSVGKLTIPQVAEQS